MRLGHQMSNHKEKRFFFLRCLNSFTKKKVLDKHTENCEKHDCVKLRMPENDSILEFKNLAFNACSDCGFCRF